MRIAKYLVHCGVCSRREGEKLIAAGRVAVDGKVIDHPSFIIAGEENVCVDGKPVQKQTEPILWLVNKPAGVITTHRDPEGRPTIWDFLKSEKFPVHQHWITVGRLDLMSEGLILVTNDGDWSQKVSKSNWPRTYRVRVRGPQVNWEPFALQGITIDGIRYAPFTVKEHDVAPPHGSRLDKNRWVSVTLTEGKNREIRKIMEHFGLQVSRLIRTHFGAYSLDSVGHKAYVLEKHIEVV